MSLAPKMLPSFTGIGLLMIVCAQFVGIAACFGIFLQQLWNDKQLTKPSKALFSLWNTMHILKLVTIFNLDYIGLVSRKQEEGLTDPDDTFPAKSGQQSAVCGQICGLSVSCGQGGQKVRDQNLHPRQTLTAVTKSGNCGQKLALNGGGWPSQFRWALHLPKSIVATWPLPALSPNWTFTTAWTSHISPPPNGPTCLQRIHTWLWNSRFDLPLLLFTDAFVIPLSNPANRAPIPPLAPESRICAHRGSEDWAFVELGAELLANIERGIWARIEPPALHVPVQEKHWR